MTSLCNRLALKSGIDGHPESPQVGHCRPANTSQGLKSIYVVTSNDKDMQSMRHLSRYTTLNCDYFGYYRSQKYLPCFRNLTAVGLIFGHLQMSSTHELATCTTKMCNIL